MEPSNVLRQYYCISNKHRSDTSQDALKMFQNISNVPVKQSFLMYDMLKAKIDRLALKIISKNKKPF